MRPYTSLSVITILASAALIRSSDVPPDDDQIPSLSFDADVPRLLEEDFTFIDDLQTETSWSSIKRDTFADNLGDLAEDTWTKWMDWQMDKWFEAFVQNVWVPSKDDHGSPTRLFLVNSTNFLADFFRSVGDEQTEPNPCVTIISGCTYQHSDDNSTGTWRAGITAENIQRARFARKAIILWRNNIADGYNMFAQAQFDTTLDITAIRKNFVHLEQAKPASPLAVILPLLSLLGAFVPGIGPAVSIIGSIAAIGANRKRSVFADDVDDHIEHILKRQGEVVVYDPDFAGAQSMQRDRSDAFSTDNPLKSIPDLNEPGSLASQVKELEDKASKAKLKLRASKVIDSLKNLYRGWKAMNPKLQVEQAGDWENFDARTMSMLGTFKNNIADSYAANTKTWYPAPIVTPAGLTVASAGMKSVLAGGQPYRDAPDSSFDLVASTQALQDFFRKTILMEVLKSQSVYIWKQHFRSQDDCQTWQSDFYRAQQLTHSGTDWCEPVGSDWQIRIARLPMKRYAQMSCTVLGCEKKKKRKRQEKRDMGMIGSPTRTDIKYDAIKIAPPYKDDGASYVQVLNTQADSAFYDKWTDAKLADAHIGDSATQNWLTTSAIAELSVSCQAAQGDPFTLANPSRADLYKAPRMEQYDPSNASMLNPLCLLGLPVLDINDGQLAQWCVANQGKYVWHQFAGDGPSRFDAGGRVCGDFASWAGLGDSKVCGMGGEGWMDEGVRPGCEDRTAAFEKLG